MPTKKHTHKTHKHKRWNQPLQGVKHDKFSKQKENMQLQDKGTTKAICQV